MKVKYTIPIRPKPKQRPRFASGCVYTPKETVEYENALRTAVKSQGAQALPNACIVDMSCYWKRPKNKTDQDFFTKRPDVDNLGKCLDALNGIAWVDDAQIVQLTVSKDYGEEDRVDIEIQYL